MNILAIDTSTETLGLCLKRENEKISIYTSNQGLQHASKLLSAMEYLLAANDISIDELNLIVCSIGPGSFTGLRISLATAKGLAAGCACPLVGVSTLEALAYPFSYSDAVVVPVIDAKKQQIYTAFFQKGTRITGDLDIPPLQLATALKAYPHILLTGPMAANIYETCQWLPGRKVDIDPQYAVIQPYALVKLGEKHFLEHGAAADTLCPVYIRKSEAELKAP